MLTWVWLAFLCPALLVAIEFGQGHFLGDLDLAVFFNVEHFHKQARFRFCDIERCGAFFARDFAHVGHHQALIFAAPDFQGFRAYLGADARVVEFVDLVVPGCRFGRFYRHLAVGFR